METKHILNVFNDELVSDLKNYYYSHTEFDTDTMKKTKVGTMLEKVQPYIDSYIGTTLNYTRGNFYKHSIPYLPHTDFKKFQNTKYNIVIPLEYTGTMPYLVIFDQLWETDSITWCMNYPVLYFDVNTGVKGYPNEYPVKNLTNAEIDTEFYNNFLSHYPKEMLVGLSGKAYPFIPGSLLIFDPKRIHCTSTFTGEKLGLTIGLA